MCVLGLNFNTKPSILLPDLSPFHDCPVKGGFLAMGTSSEMSEWCGLYVQSAQEWQEKIGALKSPNSNCFD